MENLNRYQKAGAIGNKTQRDNAIKKYNENPKICLNCGKKIEIIENQKVKHIKKKKFCNRSCSAVYNNKLRGLTIVKKETKKQKVKVEKPKKIKFDYLSKTTKKELFDKCGIYYRFRAIIRKHAHFLYNKSNGHSNCKVCGYDKHVEVCHIKSVSSFNEDALITEINDINNLVGLCPNHHWEFDNGLIIL